MMLITITNPFLFCLSNLLWKLTCKIIKRIKVNIPEIKEAKNDDLPVYIEIFLKENVDINSIKIDVDPQLEDLYSDK